MDTAEAGPGEQLHDLLLSLAGRVDDDAVNTIREMLGTGHQATAAEFLVGCLLAGRIPVTAPEQQQLDRVLDELRCPREFADRLNVVDAVPDAEHRFSEQHSTGEDLVAALDPIAGRLSGVRGLWCAWRTTPAGVTYGAVPQRVLLAEVGSDGSVLASGYQLVEALRRGGVSCSVDVFATGTDLPTYHRDALGSARRVHLDLPVGAATGHASPNHGRAPRTSSTGEPAGISELSNEPLTPPPDPVPEEFRAEQWWGDSAESVEQSTLDEPAEAEIVAEYPAEDPGELSAGSTASSLPAEQAHEQTFEEAVEELAGTAPPEADSDEKSTREESDEESAEDETDEDTDEENAETADGDPAQQNMRVPAAVDAKLTDRERNLLRKLHEELAQREHDRDGNERPAANQSWSEMPGTGGFPSLGAGSGGGRQYRRQ